MTEINKLERLVMGNDNFAELMAGFSILSDAQEMLTNGTDPEKINDVINHAKGHIGKGMEGFHKELNLPGEFIIKSPMNIEDRFAKCEKLQMQECGD